MTHAPVLLWRIGHVEEVHEGPHAVDDGGDDDAQAVVEAVVQDVARRQRRGDVTDVLVARP